MSNFATGETFRQLGPDTWADLANLAKHPAWPTLFDYWKAVASEAVNRAGQTALNDGAKTDTTALEYAKGYWKGVLDVLDTPRAAESKLERHAMETAEGD